MHNESRINMKLVLVIVYRNYLFRASFHIILGDENEHSNLRSSLYDTFEHLPIFLPFSEYNNSMSYVWRYILMKCEVTIHGVLLMN